MLTRKSTKEQLRSAKLSNALNNSVVIVTGASSGIGAATAREFAKHGAQVILAARRTEELAIQVQTITNKGYNTLAIPTDITDVAQVTKVVEQTLAQFGKIDVLVNNAGIGRIRPFFKESEEYEGIS
ncbi:MAG: SDR family NAD(P)-dependent oxidoreductase [Ktedonobacteraceae bacterium]